MTANFTERPPHINPRWWYRATWAARKAAVDAHNRANRPPDRTHEDPAPHPRASFTVDTEHLIEAATEMLEDGLDANVIAARLGTTVSALEQRFRRRGLKELARPFLKARKAGNVHPCPDCGAMVSERANRCVPCAAQTPEMRRMRSEVAKSRPTNFGQKRVAA